MTVQPDSSQTAATEEVPEDVLGVEQLRRARLARREFLVAVEPHRPALHAYCRRLTGNVWDAEDLVQETLAKAFARAAETHVCVRRPRAWLVRIATNAYLDQVRRARPVLVPELDDIATPAVADPAEVGEALQELMTVLPPQERAVLVLKDVFDYRLAEIASMVGTTVGAVKSALHRARGRLSEPAPRRVGRPVPDRRVLEAAAAAFSAYDAAALVDLFLGDGVMHIVGMVHETGPTAMLEGSLEHTFNLERDVRYSAEVRDFDGEPLVAIFSRPATGAGPAGLSEVWRCETQDGRIRTCADYFFCPETVTEIAAAWNVPTVLHGYRYH